MVRDNHDAHLDTSPRRSSGRATMPATSSAKVHLSNLPENLAFFSGAIDAAGSFGGIYQSAVLAYGSDLIKDPPDPERFLDLQGARRPPKRPALFKDQKVAIAPIRSGGGGDGGRQSAPEQGHPLHVRAELGRSRHAEPVEHDEPRSDQEVAPGQPGLDDSAARPRRQRARRGVPQEGRRSLRAQPGAQGDGVEPAPRRRDQAAAGRETDSVDAQRIDVVGRGWEEPVGANSDENRRVEVQWFTIE